MAKVTTPSGFLCEFDRTALDDMRVVELFGLATDESADDFARFRATSSVVEKLLGGEQKEALYDHIASGHAGRVPLRALFDELTAILKASAGEDVVKNL